MEISMGRSEMMAFLESMPRKEAFGFIAAFKLAVALTGATDFKIHFKERNVEFFNEKMTKLCEFNY